jgi:serine/threonine protein kinase
VHRDIKPENFVMKNEQELVLVDFGVSKRFEGEDDTLKGTAGTKLFFAPEIVKTGVKNKVIHGK